MNTMAIGLGTLTIILFILHALMSSNEGKTSKDFFFAGSSLNSDRIAANLSATSSSLGTALMFLLFQTPVYGYLIFLIIVMFLFGQFVFLKVASKIGRVDSTKFGSVYRLVLNGTNSTAISRAANIINVLTYGALLLVEITIGASIFTFFAPSIPHATLVGVIFISAGVVLYVLIGGFEIVTFSDKWQFWFLFTAVSLTFLFLSFVTISNNNLNLFDAFQVFSNFPEGSFWVISTFIANVLIVNTLLPICQSASWQRFSSAASNSDFIKGYTDAFIKQLIWAWVLFAVVSAIFYKLNGSSVSGISDLFSFVSKQSILGGWFVFPILFAGLVAAIVSTADSLMVALMLGIDDFYSHRTSESNNEILLDETLKRPRYILWGILSVVAIILSYTLFNSVAPNTKGIIIGLMFTAVGQTILLFPIIFYSVTFGAKNTHNIQTSFTVVSLFLGFVVLWGLSIYGISQGDVGCIQIAPIIALIITSTGTFLSIRRKNLV